MRFIWERRSGTADSRFRGSSTKMGKISQRWRWIPMRVQDIKRIRIRMELRTVGKKTAVSAETYSEPMSTEYSTQHAIRDFLAERKGVRPETYENGETFSMAKYKEEQYDKMAKIIRENLDMDMIYRILERKDVR